MSMNWSEFFAESPQLAVTIRGRFEAHLHHIISTLTAKGSPRGSGTEVRWWEENLWLGSMPGSRKSADLIGDSRYSLHSHPDTPELLEGDAKVAGVAIHVAEASVQEAYATFIGFPSTDPFDLFRLTLASASLVRVSEDKTHLVITSWSEASGTRVIERF